MMTSMSLTVPPRARFDASDEPELLVHAFRQLVQEGRYVLDRENEVREALDAGRESFLPLIDSLEQTERLDGWPYDESDDGADGHEVGERAPTVSGQATDIPLDAVTDRIAGAWYGRCIGCLLGKPVEGWAYDDIEAYLARGGVTEITDYLPRLPAEPGSLAFNAIGVQGTFRGEIDGMARDDDVDYTILALRLAEQFGPDFQTADVARLWLALLPYHQVFTAERAALRNLIVGAPLSQVARRHNPYREWIGALIRADFWGYVLPGRPRRAAELAARDARLSHVANGIHGARWAAALVSSALTSPSVAHAFAQARAVVPDRTRLAEALDRVYDTRRRGASFDRARAQAVDELGHYGPVHTISNAAMISTALLWGEGDFTRSIGLSVRCGWDTDSNGATVGSVTGALTGRDALPGQWTAPIAGHVRSAIFGEATNTVDALVTRTVALLPAFAASD
jgi:ADP-ribosylglycohydrolase